MAEKHIEGRDGVVTVITEGYGYGTIERGLPTPVEDPSQWRKSLWTDEDICKRYNWTQADLHAALSSEQGGGRYAFPRPDRSGLKLSARNFWTPRNVREWREEKILDWEANIRALAAKLPKIR
jgi:hypothetical protein